MFTLNFGGDAWWSSRGNKLVESSTGYKADLQCLRPEAEGAQVGIADSEALYTALHTRCIGAHRMTRPGHLHCLGSFPIKAQRRWNRHS